MLTRPHFAVTPADDVRSAVPTFVRFFRAFQLLDEEGQSCVLEAMSLFDDSSPADVEREHAREVIIEALFAAE